MLLKKCIHSQIKTHLQSQSNQCVAVGYQHRHTGFLAAFQSLYGVNGLTGLWRGVSASVVRVAVGSAAQLSTFSESREAINKLQVKHIEPIIIGRLKSTGFSVDISSQFMEINFSCQHVEWRRCGIVYDTLGRCFHSAL